jgi:4-methylaminobutanoate oxidase (formaldehyde-forming)
VDLDKPEFTGKAALAGIKTAGPARKLSTFTLDGFVPLHGGEPIMLDGVVVGSVTSGGFGHHLGCTIGFGYVPTAAANGSFTIEAFGKSYPATKGPRVLYDAKMERLKG